MGNYKRFMDDIGKEIGYGIKKNDHHITPMSKAIVVLRKINSAWIKTLQSPQIVTYERNKQTKIME